MKPQQRVSCTHCQQHYRHCIVHLLSMRMATMMMRFHMEPVCHHVLSEQSPLDCGPYMTKTGVSCEGQAGMRF
jgi:hypothetical protein